MVIIQVLSSFRTKTPIKKIKRRQKYFGDNDISVLKKYIYYIFKNHEKVYFKC